MKEQFQNTIEIACTPEQLYRYITQPSRWHEWHPNSKSAHTETPVLSAGDKFTEIIELQPLSPLPLTLTRKTQHQVLLAEPHQRWQVRGEMAGGWLQINYEFVASAIGVTFTRTLIYEAKGVHRLFMPFLKSRMRAISLIALGNLKAKLESSCAN